MRPQDPDASFEALLQRPPLRAPSNNLDARLNATFIQARFNPPRQTVFRLFAIAAILILMIGIGLRFSLRASLGGRLTVPTVATSLPAPASTLKAISIPNSEIQIERVTSTVYDEGVIAATDDAAYRKFRRRTVREIWYINPQTRAQMQVTIPADEVLIEKVEAF